MNETSSRAVAIVGLGAILPDGPDVATFWSNVKDGRYSISEVPVERWDPELYYDPDPKAPDKTYSKIGGWVRRWDWDPMAWHLPIPPRVSEAMDDGQKWAITCAREALADYGYPSRSIDLDRTAVILGNALAGEKHYMTAMRIYFPEFAEELRSAPNFMALPNDVQAAILDEMHMGAAKRFPEITEDTMPGELGNILAGRVANLFNLRGPNFVTDAACASAMAALGPAITGLAERQFDAVLTGGIDRNMGAVGFVKFSKIGALSATGTRPYADGADGFVMGEGAAVFLLKRLDDAEKDGDRIYAVIRSVAGASDGRGKGITAPNPIGQRLAVERAWSMAGESPTTVTLVEGHGTSTRVGDVVEVEALSEALGSPDVPAGSIALGSVKSNIGHLKAAAGAAGLLKTILAISEKVLPPSLNCERPNPNIDWSSSPFRVNTALREWQVPAGTTRRAGVSAFGFGGTNFHAVLEEHVPGRLTGDGRKVVAVPERPEAIPAVIERPAEQPPMNVTRADASGARVPLRGALVVGGADDATVAGRLREALAEARAGRVPRPAPPAKSALEAPVRVAIDFADATELSAKCEAALKALESDQPAMWKALGARGIFRGEGPAPKVAFLYTGQGSQYANMLAGLRKAEPIVAEVFDEADRIMTPLLGRSLSSYVFVDPADPEAIQRAEEDLRRTEITQPAVLATDLALTRLLAAYGIEPDMVMGHSLGEYGALVAAGALSFEGALEAVSARGREMATIDVPDHGKMAAILAPLEEVQRVLSGIDGNVVIANINSTSQAVIGGATVPVEQAVAALVEAGYQAIPLPVSHAFHTSIVAPASEPLRRALQRLDLHSPARPIVANVSGEFYPMGEDVVPQMLDVLAAQVASPVQFVKGLRTLFEAGARVFVEVGPKKALHGFVDDVLGAEPDVLSLFTNHPKTGDLPSFNQALCGLYAAGLGAPRKEEPTMVSVETESPARTSDDLERLFGEFLDRARHIQADGPIEEARPSVVITGAALGLPGTERVFDDRNVSRLLAGEQFIDVIPTRVRQAMLDKHIVRLVKPEDGEPTFEAIEDSSDVIKLAGRSGAFDLAEEFGVEADRIPALDRATQLAVGAGLDALRDAGIPLVLRYRTTSKGTKLPDRWVLPEALCDDTGVIFASAFPGLDAFTYEVTRYHLDRARRQELASLESAGARLAELNGAASVATAELDRRIHSLRAQIEREPYVFDRRFLFKCLSMGHAQFAEIVGARGPNTQVNAACASTTQALAMAQDWIREGRCRRVVVIAADEATSDTLFEWIGAGFLASGAAATDEVVEDAATPFDRRRHGMIVGMGAASLVVEREDDARGRGIRPICEVLATEVANSAFHGSRLDVSHITQVMERLVAKAEQRWGIARQEIAGETVFVSHETYTPARGGSAAAEVEALRHVFGEATDQIVVANTKGFTGHPMGVGLEDVVAVKALETGVVPPVPNFKEVDPDLGTLNLSKGGVYPIRYAIRLAAGFGSQIGMSLLRWVPTPDGRRPHADELGYACRIEDRKAWSRWLSEVVGHPDPPLEVVQRRLRVRDGGAPAAPEPLPAIQRAIEPEPIAVVEPAPVTVAVAETVPEPVATPEAPEATSEAGPIPTEVEDRVLSLVAEVTGYPRDMLDLDLDLEADLGIDTVKQAEIFANLRESYGIEREENLKLRDFPTLAHVIGFMQERAPGRVGRTPAVDVAPPTDGAIPTEVEDRVLSLVAEVTGYPRDMLDLDLDLEADLGIDTVKQAEIFANLRESYGIEREENLKLRDFPTLAHVIGFMQERAGSSAPGKAVTDCEDQETASDDAAVPASATTGFEAANTFPARIPVPVIRPGLEVFAPTGVSLGAGGRVVIMADAGGVWRELVDRLKALDVESLVIEDRPEVDVLVQRLRDWTASGPAKGVYWLPALDPEPPLSDMDLSDWREAARVRVKLMAATMRALTDSVGESGTFLVTGSRMGGRHGYDSAGATAPMGGAVVGFAKAWSRERPDALVKAVDFLIDAEPAQVADSLLGETLRDPGASEIGCTHGLRWTIGLAERPDEAAGTGIALGPGSVFVVTGAAGSIVSAIVSDLAAASGATFHLLDLAAEPDPADPDLARFATDRDGLKRELFGRIKASGERATPAVVERDLARLERLDAALRAMSAIRAAGGEAVYHQVDLTDADAVRAVIESVRAAHGRIDVLIHAAGMEISHLLRDKEQREFDLVFDVKADGLFNLMKSIGDLPIGATVAFSSVAGRFGNLGQTDYSAANHLLCTFTSSFRRTRPTTQAIAIDWTAWAGIGMASRGSIPKLMEAAGIEMLPADAGIPVIRRELATGRRGEIVVAGKLGTLLEPRHPSGGTDAGRVAAAGPMIGRFLRIDPDGTVVAETTLDPREHLFLDHHRIEGTPVLPGVMGIEAFAELAGAVLPRWRIEAVHDVQFLAPLKFYRDDPRTLTVEAALAPVDGAVEVRCRLLATRLLANRPEPETTVHFTGVVRMVPETEAAPTCEPLVELEAGHPDHLVEAGAIYDVYFHGPAYQVLGGALVGHAGSIGMMTDDLPEDRSPAEVAMFAEPRLIEICFQTAGIWELANMGRLALPTSVGRIELTSATVSAGAPPVRAIVVRRDDGGSFDADVLDADGRRLAAVRGYRTIGLPGGVDPTQLIPFHMGAPVP